MPRSIDIEKMRWKEDSDYAPNEPSTDLEVLEHAQHVGNFYDDTKNGRAVAIAKLGKFDWEMVISNNKDRQASAETNTKADEIFNWAKENLSGKWMLNEYFGYRFTCAYASYIIEDATDRKKFAAQWGDVFGYTEPTDSKPARVLTNFEKARKQAVAESIKAAFDASAKVLPLYKGLPEYWTFVSAKVDGDDKLFILPNDQIGDVTCLYGNNLEKNMVRQLATILEGRDNFTASSTFESLVNDMISGCGPDMFRAREVDGCRYALVAKNKADGQEESYHGDNHSFKDFRRAYSEGWDLTFHFGGASFTYNINNPLVAYRESENGGIAVSDGYGHFTRGEYSESVTGQFSRDTGLPEGEWSRTTHVSGGTNYKGPQTAKAVYEKGKLLEGSLQPLGSYSDKYQPAPPKLVKLGQKKAATPK